MKVGISIFFFWRRRDTSWLFAA